MHNWLIFIAYSFLSIWVPNALANSVDYEKALRIKIESTLQAGCGEPQSELAQVLCTKRLRFGVLINFPPFSVHEGTEFKGFEIDLAKVIAKRLGVQVEFLGVSVTNRIEKLINRDIDVILAALSHTLARDRIIDFVLPHYYSSPTSIVGPKDLYIKDWHDLEGKSICVPAGNFSNIEFSKHQTRLLIYDQPDRMIDALRMGACTFIATDKALLQANVFGPLAPIDLSDRFEEKLSFNNVPWGIGVRKDAQEDLGRAISFILADLQQSGALQNLARAYSLDIPFLSEQLKIFSRADCLMQNQLNPNCLGGPSDLSDSPTIIAPYVGRFEKWLKKSTNISLSMPVFSGQQASKLFLTGLIISLILVVGSILTTISFAIFFYQLLRSKYFVIRLLGQITVNFFQNSPIILLLVLGYLLITFLMPYSQFLAVSVSVIVIGLNNGANASSAMSETALVSTPNASLLYIAKGTSNQLRAAIINATKATPVAGFIGTPEILNVLTDITSFTGERLTTYITVSIFYLIAVHQVIKVTDRIHKRLQANDS